MTSEYDAMKAQRAAIEAKRPKPMTDEEQTVVEAAVEWAMWREACHYGPGSEHLKRAERDLENAVFALHAEHDGRWKPA